MYDSVDYPYKVERKRVTYFNSTCILKADTYTSFKLHIDELNSWKENLVPLQLE